MVDPLERMSVHFMHLYTPSLGWTKVKSAKCHIIFEFIMMWTWRPVTATPSSVVFQNIPLV